MAMSDQVTGGPIPDVVTLKTKSKRDSGSLAVKPAPPTAQMVAKFERKTYAERADRIVIRHGRGEVIAIIEIVSPGNKHNNASMRKFIQKSLDFMDQGIHLLIVDLHPPTKRDPNGLQQAISEERYDMKFELPTGKNRTAGAYFSGEVPAVYLESFGVGDPLPSLPIFLTEDDFVSAPLESTYMQAWEVFPKYLKEVMAGTADEQPD